jgi:tRNA dimethylallyltransferase
MENKVIVILGATATRKSEVALHLSNKFPIEIISADSMQFYKGMDIGTAKVSKEIREKITHNMIDAIDISEDYSVADFKKNVIDLMQKIFAKERFPLIVGGSGLYIRAVTENFPVEESVEPNLELRKILMNTPIVELGKTAAEIDPVAVSLIGASDRKRLIRAIEYYKQTGKLISSVANSPSNLEFLKIGLTKERSILYEDINKRVDIMFEKGFVEEVEGLRIKYKKWSATAIQAIGYKELIDYFEGHITLNNARETIKQKTRNFAKRQITWFKKERNVIWFDSSNLDDILPKIENLGKEFLYENK